MANKRQIWVYCNSPYDPFGMIIIGRNWGNEEYRFGFNGKENTDEISGDDNSIDFGARIYDSRLGRWLSVDPLASDNEYISPYVFALNSTIRYNDPTGMEPDDQIGGGYYTATVNSRTIGFSIRHPKAALAIGTPTKGSTNISTNAVRFSTRIGLIENKEHEASQVNAFRHALWQAEITKEFGNSIANELGNAHEENPLAATGSNLKKSFATLAEADETVDLLNNVIGRFIGTVYSDANMQELALQTLDYYKYSGLWSATAVTDDKGKVTGYTISQTKLSQEQYNSAKEIIQGLNADGFTSSEQYARDREAEAAAEKERREIMNGPKF